MAFRKANHTRVGLLGQMDENTLPIMICLAGFGDQPDMFDPLFSTALSDKVRLLPLALPGFGAPPLAETTLEALADFVATKAKQEKASYLIGHSVASIIASMAADRLDGQIIRHFSLEGNLTDKDAYFSGKAAQFASAGDFMDYCKIRNSNADPDDAILMRYWQRVVTSDASALWQLGLSAFRYSQKAVPGDLLQRASPVTYLYNPDNLHSDSLAYLNAFALDRAELAGASHWPTLDQPEAVSAVITERL